VHGFLGVPLTASDGQIIGALSVRTRKPIHESLNMEITLRALAPRIGGELERLQLEAELRRSVEQFQGESRLQSVIDAMPDMIFRIDASGTYRDFISGAGTSPLVPPNAFLGRNIAEIMPEEGAVAAMRAIQVALERRETQRMSYPLFIGGKLRYREARIVPIGEDEVLAFVRDVTEQDSPVRSGREQQRPLIGGLNANYQIPYGLTLREVGVLRHVARGLGDKEIAEALSISTYTVNKHVAAILSKMGVPSRTAAGVNAVREGILMNDPDGSVW
jgi:DNA-binding CsgD family transcriptional regulator/PAS domain-containing protein